MVLSQDGWAGCVAGPVGEGDGVAVDTADADTRLLSVAVLPVPPDGDAAPADAIVAEARAVICDLTIVFCGGCATHAWQGDLSP
jgi:hypothetical protein